MKLTQGTFSFLPDLTDGQITVGHVQMYSDGNWYAVDRHDRLVGIFLTKQEATRALPTGGAP